MACRFSPIGAHVATARYTKTMADARKPRWYHLTPDRVVVALLALEGFLLLSARLEWFAFNRHRGWSVLVAVAGVGAVLLVMSLWFAAALIFRWRFQFSIRALLVLTVVVAIPFSWLATEMKKATVQKEAVEGLVRLGDYVVYDCMPTLSCTGAQLPDAQLPGPAWLRHLVGNDFFASVESVSLLGHHSTDAEPQRLEALRQLKWLHIVNCQATDSWLGHLKGLNQLQVLYAYSTKITDAGLEHLEGLAQLQIWTSPRPRSATLAFRT